MDKFLFLHAGIAQIVLSLLLRKQILQKGLPLKSRPANMFSNFLQLAIFQKMASDEMAHINICELNDKL